MWRFIVLGFVFGMALYLGEAFSWFRIQEMFRFESFHMYGIIFSAVLVGAIGIQLIKAFKIKSMNGELINLEKKPMNKKGNSIGGFIFGVGWAMTGFCVGPVFVLLGYGSVFAVLVVLGMLIGVLLYGYLQRYLPH